MAFHLFPERFHAFHEIITAVAEDDAVIYITHIRPIELFVGDMVEYFSQHGLWPVYLTDIVYAHVPFIVASFEDVGEAAGGIVSFQDEAAFSFF